MIFFQDSGGGIYVWSPFGAPNVLLTNSIVSLKINLEFSRKRGSTKSSATKGKKPLLLKVVDFEDHFLVRHDLGTAIWTMHLNRVRKAHIVNAITLLLFTALCIA